MNRETIAVRVSSISIYSNAALTLFKLAAGIIAHSGAMISDAVHSASDVLGSVIVIIGVKLSGKEPDEEHPYGHERFECVTAIVLAVILCFTGLLIGRTAIEKLSVSSTDTLHAPGRLALLAAGISIVVKELMFRYTRHYANLINSGSLMAEAWHHRSDALSSIGALIGIVGARMGSFRMEPAASLVISGFIIKAAYDIFSDSVEKMVDHSCSIEMQNEIMRCILDQNGVEGIDRLRTRVFGNRVYIDVEICADGKLTLEQGHDIAEKVHREIEERFASVKHIMVHVNPTGSSGRVSESR